MFYKHLLLRLNRTNKAGILKRFYDYNRRLFCFDLNRCDWLIVMYKDKQKLYIVEKKEFQTLIF